MADTHGIVYTPPPIVRFMVASVEDILKKQFGKTLGSPKASTSSTRLSARAISSCTSCAKSRKTALPTNTPTNCTANEIMLLPYYIACMNIEHDYLRGHRPIRSRSRASAWWTRSRLAEKPSTNSAFSRSEHRARSNAQKDAPIFVIIGNPPYNTWQANENDNNKNRKYPVIDERVADTYAADSKATTPQQALRSLHQSHPLGLRPHRQ